MISGSLCNFMHETTLFERQMNDLDSFFMGYIENIPEKERVTVKKLLT